MPKRLDTLKRALSIVGSKKALCAVLWISNDELNGYLKGERPIPEPVYQVALQIVQRDAKKE
jgi:DNA-binding transcriptional regulator YdaS (Cro superfamily)